MTATPMMSDGGNDPVGRLADLIDSLDDHVKRAESVAQRSEGNRVSILYVHAVYALMIAPAFAAVGKAGMSSPIWSALRHVPGAPGSLAVVMFVGGVILAIATTLANRRWEMVGLAFLIAWYVTVAVSFALGVLMWAVQGQNGATPGFYAPLVYAHFTSIMLVHVWTLRKMRRAERRGGTP